MTAPNMAAITESLERSFQNFSINNTHRSGVVISEETGRSSSFSSSSNSPPSVAPESNHPQSSETILELNSHLSLPYHWEQCLDLKTGEVYYVNWRNGMKAKEDPRTSTIMTEYNNGNSYSENEEETSYDSEESSSESSPSPSSSRSRDKPPGDHVLIVAGCKSCLMYFMVPKQVADCPKCNGQLLHFDR